MMRAGARRRSANAEFLDWQIAIAQASPPPWLAPDVSPRGMALRPRVARCYAQIRTLPRRTRRALQRQLARSAALRGLLEDWSAGWAGRSLQRQLARSTAGAALLLALGPGGGWAATITVTTDRPVIKADGRCSLIEAIVNANDDAATHPDCPPGRGADTIVLSRGSYILTAVDNTTYGATGLPVIASEVTIDGHQARIARSGSAPPFRILAVGPLGDLTLREVTVSGGEADAQGGGLLNHGTLTIRDSTVSGNDAGRTGGGIANDAGTLTIETSRISGNTAGGDDGHGGGVANSGTATIINSTISGNTAVGQSHSDNSGGGIHNRGALSILSSTVSGNTSGLGGAYIILPWEELFSLRRALLAATPRVREEEESTSFPAGEYTL